MARRFWVISIGVAALVTIMVVGSSSASAHEASPGAWAWGVHSFQPEQAEVGEFVPGAHVEIGALHKSWVYGISFALTMSGNQRFKARLVYNGKTIAKERFRSDGDDEDAVQFFTLRRWVRIPGMSLENFDLQLAYRGECGSTVPKVKVEVRLENLLVYSPGHGGYQKVSVAPGPPMPPDEPNILLTCSD